MFEPNLCAQRCKFEMAALKCNSCNIVIDELLSYIQNKISIVDEETLVRICTSSFSSEEIKNSKSLLFDSIPTDRIKINRKNKGKGERDLYDIINLFKATEPDIIPVFVARQLEKLPPILFDHIDCTKLLKDLLKIQGDLDVIKSSYVTQSQLSECKIELLQNIKTVNKYSLPPINTNNVNLKSSACSVVSDGLSTELLHTNNQSINEPFDDNGSNLNSRCTRQEFSETLRVDRSEEQSVHESAVLKQPLSVIERDGAMRKVYLNDADRQVDMTSLKSAAKGGQCTVNGDNTGSRASERHRKTNTSTVKASAPGVSNGVDESWQRVARRKPVRYRYQGTAGISRDMEGNFKAADTKIPIFITKIHKDTLEKDIVDYVYKKTNEKITLEKIIFKQERNHKAYKFFVSECKLSVFLDDKLWPQGVIFRRFVNFHRNTNSNFTVSAENKTNNGKW